MCCQQAAGKQPLLLIEDSHTKFNIEGVLEELDNSLRISGGKTCLSFRDVDEILGDLVVQNHEFGLVLTSSGSTILSGVVLVLNLSDLRSQVAYRTVFLYSYFAGSV